MSGFDATKFRANLLNANPASSAYFELAFLGLPPCFEGEKHNRPDLVTRREHVMSARGIRPQKWEDNFADFRFRAMATDLPARQLETQERRYNGPSRLIPYGLLYSNLNVELIEGKNLRMREFLDAWMDFIYGGEKGMDYYPRPLYYDDIICNMELRVYDKSGNIVRTYILQDCFPVTVAPSHLSWANDNQFIVVPVEFAFHDFIALSSFDNTGMVGSNLNG